MQRLQIRLTKEQTQRLDARGSGGCQLRLSFGKQLIQHFETCPTG